MPIPNSARTTAIEDPDASSAKDVSTKKDVSAKTETANKTEVPSIEADPDSAEPPPRGRTLVRVLAAVVVIAIAGGFVFYRSRSAHSAKVAAEASSPAAMQASRVVPVIVATVDKRDVPLWLEGLGSVAASQQVTVHSQVDGRLDKVLFREGQVVRRGDLLAQIDPRPFEVQLHTAEGALARDRAQLEGGKLNLERYRTLRTQSLVPQQQVDDQIALVGQTEGAVRIDQASVESARLNLDYARIVAPIDGVLGVRLIDAGNLVHAADPSGLVIITRLDPAAVFFTLPQDQLAQVAAAQKRGEVKVEAWSRDGSTQLGAGTLVVLDNQINQATSTVRLKAILPNEERRLWPNQFVKARLLVDTQRDSLVLPAAAVQRGPQGTFVYVVAADQTAAMRPVEVGLITTDTAVITKGVTQGEQVVIEGQSQLRPGTKVSVGTGHPSAKADAGFAPKAGAKKRP